MTDQRKITERASLPASEIADGDLFSMVDVSAGIGGSKSMLASEVLIWLAVTLVTKASLPVSETKTADFNVSALGGTYFIDASSGPVEANLTATPAQGKKWTFKVIDATNTVKVLRNGRLLEGLAEDLTILGTTSPTLEADENENYWITS